MKIICLCFTAPVVFVNFNNVLVLFIYKLIDFTPDKVTYYGVQGCFNENRMQPVSFFIIILTYLIISIMAFLLSKNASEKHDSNLMVWAAFLFYPAVNRGFFKIVRMLSENPLSFIKARAILEKQSLPFFGNLYNYNWTTFFVSGFVNIFYLWIAYQIVFKHWDKKLRIYFFTFGAIACLFGNLFWYYFLGPLIYK